MKKVLVAQLWNEADDSCQFMCVAENEENMDLWVKAQWGNPVRWAGQGHLEGYALLGPDGEYLGFDIIVQEAVVQ